MVIESDRENQGHDEEQDQDAFVVGADYQEEKEADQQNKELGGDDIRENCTYKEAVFALEEGHAVRAVMPDVERLVNNPRLPTRRATQSHRAPQNPLDLFQVYFQGCPHILREVHGTSKECLPQRRKGAAEESRRAVASLREKLPY
jgi:hypothetical protein